MINSPLFLLLSGRPRFERGDPPAQGWMRYYGWSASHLSMPLFFTLTSNCSAALFVSHSTILTTLQGIPYRVLGVALELCLANRVSTSPAVPQ